eukprot:703788-Prymnesium_polylepis.1
MVMGDMEGVGLPVLSPGDVDLGSAVEPLSPLWSLLDVGLHLPLAGAHNQLGTASWHDFVLDVSHRSMGSAGVVDVITRAGRGSPVFHGAVTGPQLRPLWFSEETAVAHTSTSRRWRARYDGLCQPGVYSLTIRLLLTEFDPANSTSLRQRVRLPDYLPLVPPNAT